MLLDLPFVKKSALSKTIFETLYSTFVGLCDLMGKEEILDQEVFKKEIELNRPMLKVMEPLSTP